MFAENTAGHHRRTGMQNEAQTGRARKTQQGRAENSQAQGLEIPAVKERRGGAAHRTNSREKRERAAHCKKKTAESTYSSN